MRLNEKGLRTKGELSMKIVSFVSSKGGVGKSSSTILTANYLSAAGKTVLVIDTDYSNSTTLYYLESKAGLQGKGFASAIKSGSLTKNIVPTRNERIDILPSNTDIERLVLKDDFVLSSLIESEKESLRLYDFIFIDTSQGFSSTIANAIRASEIILTPVLLCQFDMISCLTLQSKIVEADKLASWGIFFNGVNQYAQNKNSSHYQYISLYKKTFSQCLNLFLPKTSAVTNSIDRDVRITRKNNEKVFDGIKGLVSVITDDILDDVESF
jgi:cellulose biosynthesis protein BcsQ